MVIPVVSECSCVEPDECVCRVCESEVEVEWSCEWTIWAEVVGTVEVECSGVVSDESCEDHSCAAVVSDDYWCMAVVSNDSECEPVECMCRVSLSDE